MKFQNIFLSLTFSSIAGALPPCGVYQAPTNELVHDVNIIGKTDDRQSIRAGGLGFSAEEVEQLSKATVRINCKHLEGGAVFASGFVAELNDQICTNSHTFFKNGKVIVDLKSCSATNLDGIASTSSTLKLNRENSFVVGSKGGDDSGKNDFACVKLSKPFSNVTPLQVDKSGAGIRNRVIYAISAYQLRMKMPVTIGEAVVQKCRNAGVEPGSSELSSSMYIECSATDGSSGSPIVTRDKKTGQLVAVGMIATSGLPKKDFYEFSIEDGSFTQAVAFDGPALRELNKLTESSRAGVKPPVRSSKLGEDI